MLSSTTAGSFPIWLPVFIPAWLCFILLLISVMSGWRRLAHTYPAQGPPQGRKFSGQSGMVGWCKYNRCLTVHTSPEGLRLSIMFLFRLGSAPIFIPWSEIRNCSVKRFLWVEMVKFEVGFPRVGTMRLPKRVFEGYWEKLKLES